MARVDFKGEEPQNLEEKACCVFVVDTSGSMEGMPINQLNQGLQAFAAEIREMREVRHRLEVTLIEFNSSHRTLVDPTLGIDLVIPTLSTTGSTKLVDGVLAAIDAARARHKWYADTGQPSKRPWIILITDGLPDGDQNVGNLRTAIEKAEQSKEFIFLPIGVDGADMNFLNSICMKNPELKPRHMSSAKFSEFFRWVSDLMSKVVGSRPGQRLTLPKPDNWTGGVEI